MTLKNKNKKVNILLTGFVVLFIFFFLSINLSPYFFIGTLFSCGILLIQFGVQLDFENSRYREYIGFLGVKKGQWVHIDQKMKLEIKKDTVLNPTFGNTTHKTNYLLYLTYENSTVELFESSNLDKLENLQNDFCKKLRIECT